MYTGTFGNGANSSAILTNAKGEANVTLTVDTIATTFATVGISYPGQYPQSTFTGTFITTGVITTVPGLATNLQFIASYDNHCTVANPCNFKALILPPAGTGDVVNGSTVYLDIVAKDNYDNTAVISINSKHPGDGDPVDRAVGEHTVHHSELRRSIVHRLRANRLDASSVPWLIVADRVC